MKKVSSSQKSALRIMQRVNLLCVYFSPEDSVEQLPVIDPERMFNGVNNVLTAMCPRLKDFHSILVEPPKVGSFCEVRPSKKNSCV